MKLSNLNLTLCALFSLTFILACKKKDTTSTTPTNNTPTYASSFAYKKNGISQSVSSMTTNLINLGGFSYIAIAGNSTTPSQGLNLWIDPAATTGNYPFEFVGGDFVMQYSNLTLPGAYTSSGGGNLGITKHDKTAKIIEGTFSATVYDDPITPTDSIVITAGSFKAKY